MAKSKEDLNKDLFEAAKEGDTLQIILAIENGADINTTNEKDLTPLHIAAANGKSEAIIILNAMGIDINAKDTYGNTPINLAAQYGKSKAIKTLATSLEADVNAANKNGYTPLHKAAKYGKLEAIETLVTLGADVNAASKSGYTPLHEAAGYAKLEAIETLVTLGADVNAANKNGYTPIHLIAKYGNLEAIETIVNLGADVNAINILGYTTIHIAAEYDNLEAIETLVTLGVDVNAKDENDRTPLFKAAEYGNLEAIETLVTLGTDVNAKDNFSYTPLHRAAQYGKSKAIEILVTLGADVNAANKHGYTPLRKAAEYDELESIETLLKYNAQINNITSINKEIKDLIDLAKDIDLLVTNPEENLRKDEEKNITDGKLSDEPNALVYNKNMVDMAVHRFKHALESNLTDLEEKDILSKLQNNDSIPNNLKAELTSLLRISTPEKFNNQCVVIFNHYNDKELIASLDYLLDIASPDHSWSDASFSEEEITNEQAQNKIENKKKWDLDTQNLLDFYRENSDLDCDSIEDYLSGEHKRTKTLEEMKGEVTAANFQILERCNYKNEDLSDWPEKDKEAFQKNVEVLDNMIKPTYVAVQAKTKYRKKLALTELKFKHQKTNGIDKTKDDIDSHKLVKGQVKSHSRPRSNSVPPKPIIGKHTSALAKRKTNNAGKHR